MKNLFPTAEILGKAATRETLVISKARKAGTATEMAFVNILPVREREEQKEKRRRERADVCFGERQGIFVSDVRNTIKQCFNGG